MTTSPTTARQSGRRRMVDASQPLRDGTPAIRPLPPVEMSWLMRMEDGKPLDVSHVAFATHAGTHVDAPSHAIPGGRTIDEIPLDRFIRPAVVVPVEVDADGLVTADQLRTATSGSLEPGDALLIATGWGDRFGTEPYTVHPALSVDAAQWIVESGVSTVGVDLLTVDVRTDLRPDGFDFPVHRSLLGNDVLIIENLRNLSHVAGRAMMYSFPLPFAGRDAAQARVVLEV